MTAELANCHNEMAQQHAALQTPCSSSFDSSDTVRTDQELISIGERNVLLKAESKQQKVNSKRKPDYSRSYPFTPIKPHFRTNSNLSAKK